MVVNDGEGVDFWEGFCPYNIPTCIQLWLKGEETLREQFKHKKYFTSLNTSEYEARTAYNFFIAYLPLFGGKRSTKSDIGPLPDYANWHHKSLKTGLGYNIEKMLDPVHHEIKIIISMEYQTYPLLRALATEMALEAVEFISALVRWIDDTYKLLLVGGT